MNWSMYPPNVVIGRKGGTTIQAEMHVGNKGITISTLNITTDGDVDSTTIQKDLNLSEIRNTYRRHLLENV